MNKSDVIEKLRNGLVRLEFLKVNGTTRPMLATLSEDFVPVRETINETEEKSERAKNEDVLAVWDHESQGWRSFRWENLRVFDGEDIPNGVK